MLVFKSQSSIFLNWTASFFFFSLPVNGDQLLFFLNLAHISDWHLAERKDLTLLGLMFNKLNL